jgi:5-dehydro-4-deoxyglucarate dehydratase
MSSSYSPTDLVARLGSGLLSFPVTHFTDDLSFDEDAYRAHLGWLADHPAAGLFAAGGTGEFFSLTPGEVERVVRAAVAAVPDGLPIVAPAGYGTATAIELVRSAERAGASGVLLFPPYLTEAGQDGLAAHVRAVCAATGLGVTVYSRANAVYQDTTLARLVEGCPNLVGFKDGVGNLELMGRIHARIGDRLTYIGGLPTAEMFALPYLELGVTTYSSALFNFAPDFAVDFYQAVRRRDHDAVTKYLNDFVIPYCDLRARRPGYAVSIIKAGMRVIGRPAGPVRPPLTELDPTELADLERLVTDLPAREPR